eukprot:4264800-Karenia_brevis.AAC.1
MGILTFARSGGYLGPKSQHRSHFGSRPNTLPPGGVGFGGFSSPSGSVWPAAGRSFLPCSPEQRIVRCGSLLDFNSQGLANTSSGYHALLRAQLLPSTEVFVVLFRIKFGARDQLQMLGLQTQ